MAPNSALEGLSRRIVLIRGLTVVNSSKRIARFKLVGLPQESPTFCAGAAQRRFRG